MKIKFPSTETEPLNFFKWFYNNDIINDYLDWFFDDKKDINHFTEPRLNPSQKANRLDGYIEYLCPNNNFELVKVTIEESLNKYLNTQSIFSIKLITNNVNELIKNSKEYEYQLKFYIKELNDLEFSKRKLIDEFPYLLKPIIDIENYINSRYLNGNIREYISVNDINGKLINDIFGYLGGLNENNNEILNKKDYSRLISLIKHFIETGEVLYISKKIPKLNGIDNLTLRRTFYTLWCSLSNKNKYPRENIVKLLKSTFQQLEKSSERNIYDNLTKRPNYWKEFIPKIVKELL
ncbi:hypothetical protein KUL156_43180 [Alteromonas sp. KUL156]|nr:hypothetical protein KUL154_18470 [Alteromonas sp. KUL154]GFE01726.1 hypothetical protein KUL156_43180 [Alteromonas sp. KUL156]